MYMGIIYTSFSLRNLLCKTIYTMPSFMWSNELFNYTEMMTIPLSYFVFSFLKYEVSYSKKYKNLQKRIRNLFLRLAFKSYLAELTFVIDSSKLHFADQILRFRAKIGKISSATIYDRKIFCPEGFTLYLTCQCALIKPSRLKATVNVDLYLDGFRIKIS